MSNGISTVTGGRQRTLRKMSAPVAAAVRAALVLVLLLAFFLRLFRLDGQSIWWDEGISLHLATSSLPDLLADRLNNIHPPLYFIVLRGWVALTGVTAFSGRYLSVLGSLLGVALGIGVARRWYGTRTGQVMAVLATISAVSIIYAQEIRVYAWLPLIYLALLAFTREILRADAPRAALWLGLGTVTWIGIHLHYIVLFVVAYAGIWAFVGLWRQRRWQSLRRWIAVQVVVGLASLPWFVAVVANWRAVAGEANAGTFVAEAVPLPFLFAQVWVFHLTGLAGALSRPEMVWLAVAGVLLLVAVVALRLARKATRAATGLLLAHWLVPLLSALLVWSVRSFSHPRYVSLFVLAFLLLVAYLVRPHVPRDGRPAAALGLLLGVVIAAASMGGTWRYFFDPAVAKDDVRGVAALLEERAAAEDLILVPDTDWSLPFEYGGPATVAMPGVDRRPGVWDELAALTAGTPDVFVMDYARGTRDWQELLRFALESAGVVVGETAVDDLWLRRYRLDHPVREPQFVAESARFGPLLLTGAWVEEGAPADDKVTLALRWQLVEQTGERYHTALRLLDDQDYQVGARDDALRDASGRPTEQWPVGRSVDTYHIIPLNAGTPPLEYAPAVAVYARDEDDAVRAVDIVDELGAPQGQQYFLPEVSLSPPRRPADGPLPVPALEPAVVVAPGLELQGFARSPSDIAAAGQELHVDLLWRAAAQLQDVQPILMLRDGSEVIAESSGALLPERYPPSLWQVGELVHERRALRVPADFAGAAQLILRLGDSQTVLGEVTVEAGAHQFERPEIGYEVEATFGELARLIGFDLPSTAFNTSEIVPLTLYWEALESDPAGDYVVFAHILDAQGRLIGQHDAQPANGTRPTGGWIAEEIIVDPHPMIFRAEAYQGAAVIEVGLYDPRTGQRLSLPDGSDAFRLPIELSVTRAP